MSKFEKYFKECGTDKYVHGYHNFYNQILENEQIDSVLEIGLYMGSSIKAWKKIWPDALIEGVDLDRLYDKELENEFNIYNIDSQDSGQTSKINKYYDIIIDDAAHHYKYQAETFKNFYDKAKKFYVIEDVLGKWGFYNLLGLLPEDIMKKAKLFESTGPTRDFKFSDYVEPKAHFRFLIIDKR
jgi:hypothetical protein